MLTSNSRSFSSRPPVFSSNAGGKGRRKFRPDLLALETRALLSTLTVTKDNDSGTGSLRAQLAAAHAGDTINFAASAYGTINLSSGPLQVATSVNIQGPGAKNVTVSGGGKSTVFDVQNGVTATISGLTVTGGVATTGNGGGIANYGTLTLSGGAITGNSAVLGSSAAGGGVFTEGSLTVTNSTISGNSALSGGGIDSNGAR
jgi:fibronectin-binding autotransporter adhesin